MLYDAMRHILRKPKFVRRDPADSESELIVSEIGAGPLDNLFLLRLPTEPCDEVDAAFVPLSGTGPTRAFGKEDIAEDDAGGVTGLEHDGGVLWNHTGVDIHVRPNTATDPRAAYTAAGKVRDVLAQYADPTAIAAILRLERGQPEGGDMVPLADSRGLIAGEYIARIDAPTPPVFYEQDARGRPICAVSVEVWSRTVEREAA